MSVQTIPEQGTTAERLPRASGIVAVGPFPASTHPAFDDYLGLRASSFSGTRLVVFDGRSGSGKSTAIRFLLREHRDFREREATIISDLRAELPSALDVAVIEEVRVPRELPLLLPVLARSTSLLVASHVGLHYFRPLQLFGRSRLYRTDRDVGKIRRRLEMTGVYASEGAIADYVKAFGATYTDIDIVLERYPDTTFDRSLARFLRYCDLRCTEEPDSL